MLLLPIRTCFTKYLKTNILFSYGLNLRFFISRDTLQFKIVNYFENSLTHYKKSQQNAISTMLLKDLPVTIALKEKLNYIYGCIQNLYNVNTNKDKLKIYDSLNRESYILDSLEPLEILILINKMIKIVPINESRLNFFDKALSILFKNVRSTLITDYYIVQLIYFMCLKRENCVQNVRSVEKFLSTFMNFSLMELVAISSSYYRQHIKMDYYSSVEINKLLEVHSKQLIHKQELLGSICKILRTSDLCDKLILENLSKNIIKSSDSLNLITMSHVLGLYATARLLEPKVIKLMHSNFRKIIQNDITILNLRIKDIARFLWAASYLRIIFPTSTKIILNSYIEKRFTQLKMTENLGYLIDILLSLHILKCSDYKIIKHCLQENVFQQIKNNSTIHSKIKSRQNLLIDLINIEWKMNIPNYLKIIKSSVFESSPNLELIKSIGDELIEKGIIKMIKMEYPIESLYIPGVTLIKDAFKYHIDIIDNQSYLRKLIFRKQFQMVEIVNNTNISNGMLNLKTRLLFQKGYRQIRINNHIFENNNDIEVRSKILEKILKAINDEKSVKTKHLSGSYVKRKAQIRKIKSE